MNLYEPYTEVGCLFNESNYFLCSRQGYILYALPKHKIDVLFYLNNVQSNVLPSLSQVTSHEGHWEHACEQKGICMHGNSYAGHVAERVQDDRDRPSDCSADQKNISRKSFVLLQIANIVNRVVSCARLCYSKFYEIFSLFLFCTDLDFLRLVVLAEVQSCHNLPGFTLLGHGLKSFFFLPRSYCLGDYSAKRRSPLLQI